MLLSLILSEISCHPYGIVSGRSKTYRLENQKQDTDFKFSESKDLIQNILYRNCGCSSDIPKHNCGVHVHLEMLLFFTQKCSVWLAFTSHHCIAFLHWHVHPVQLTKHRIFNTNIITFRLKYGCQSSSSRRLKIFYSWTIKVNIFFLDSKGF